MIRAEFSSFEDAENTISGFISFYNNERLNSAVDYRTLERYIKMERKHNRGICMSPNPILSRIRGPIQI